jgi:hypothetical protein
MLLIFRLRPIGQLNFTYFMGDYYGGMTGRMILLFGRSVVGCAADYFNPPFG